MNLILKGLSVITLSLGATVALAAPAFLTTHNNTSEQSNAFIDGAPSPYPTLAHSTRQVYWNFVRLACYGHSTNNKCSAVIKMATDTANPIELGTVTMDTETGDITPHQMSAKGYTFTVNGLGETTISKN